MYSPKIDPELVGRLYHVARRRGVHMTKLANMLIRDGLDRMDMNIVPAESQASRNNGHGRGGRK